jgi:hypothetical protein
MSFINIVRNKTNLGITNFATVAFETAFQLTIIFIENLPLNNWHNH